MRVEPWDAYFVGGGFDKRKLRIGVFDGKPPHDLVVWFHRDALGVYEVAPLSARPHQDSLWRGEVYGLTESDPCVAHYGFLSEHPRGESEGVIGNER